MKNILKIKNTFYKITFITIILFITSIFFFSFFKIETSSNIIVKVSQTNKSLLIDSNVIYKIKNYKEIVIKIEDQFSIIKIGKIKWNENKELFELDIKSDTSILIPNTTLTAKIIYNSKPIYKVIFDIV